MQELKFHTDSRITLLDVTREVNGAVAEAGVNSGLCNLFVPHTTAAIIVSENWDPDVTSDMMMQLEKIVPRDGRLPSWRGKFAVAYFIGDAEHLDQYPGARWQARAGRWQGVMLVGV